MDITPISAKSTRFDTKTLKRYHKRTLEFMQEEADNGEIYAQAMLADYLSGTGTSDKSNMAKIAKLYEKASSGGDVISTHNLAIMYWNGMADVVTQDKQHAVHLFSIAGARGHNASLYKAGFALEYGFDEVQAQPEHAIQFYMIAAIRGHAPSQYRVGLLYKEGRGVPVDIQRSEWALRMAAHQGHSEAAELLQCLELAEEVRPLKKMCIERPMPRYVKDSKRSRAYRNILPEIEIERQGADATSDDGSAGGSGNCDKDEKDTSEKPKTYALEVLAETATDRKVAKNESLW